MNILLLKERKGESDAYMLALKNIGQVDFIPVLSINLTNNEQLKKIFEGSEFDSLIFTSGNAVKAVKSIFDTSPPSNVKKWTEKECYVVGKATKKLANDLRFECCGSNCGNAEELARLIIHESSERPGRRFLFPCGQMKREVLPTLLNEAGLPLTSVTVYESSENQNILEAITKSKSEDKSPTVAVFFSPSGVRFSLSKFEAVYGEDLKDFYCAAIGQTTADALRTAGIDPCCVAEHPTPEDLCTAIKFFLNSLIAAPINFLSSSED